MLGDPHSEVTFDRQDCGACQSSKPHQRQWRLVHFGCHGFPHLVAWNVSLVANGIDPAFGPARANLGTYWRGTNQDCCQTDPSNDVHVGPRSVGVKGRATSAPCFAPASTAEIYG